MQRLRGIDGFIAVYQPLGLSTDIVIRHAARPEGPWSQKVNLYKIEAREKVFTYSAKGHAELATRDGQLIVTWCSNIGALSDHVTRPDVYVPRAIEAQLRLRGK